MIEKKQQFWSLLLVIIIIFAIICANNNIAYDGVSVFKILLHVPDTSTSPIWTSPLFANEDNIFTNGLKFVKLNNELELIIQNKKILFIDDYNLIISSNEQTVAHGKFWEKLTFEDARDELVFSLINNNMGAEQSAGCYHSYTNRTGDFLIVANKLLPTKEVTTNDFSELHFVRGAKAVSLHGKNGLDVRLIAETLDALLMSPP